MFVKFCMKREAFFFFFFFLVISKGKKKKDADKNQEKWKRVITSTLSMALEIWFEMKECSLLNGWDKKKNKNALPLRNQNVCSKQAKSNGQVGKITLLMAS